MVGYYPKTYTEALKIINENDCIIYAGGTDLMVKKYSYPGLPAKFPKNPIFISHLKELKQIEISSKNIILGSCVTQTDILEDSKLPDIFKKVVGLMSSPGIRNSATIGGNIINASPAADLLPLLFCYDAILILESINGSREIIIEDFIVSPGKTLIKSNEILSKIILQNPFISNYYYKKVGTRKANALSKLSLLVLLDKQKNLINDIRISFGAVSPTIVRSRNIEKLITKKSVELVKSKIPEIINKYSSLINPISDQRSTKEYRKYSSLKLLENYFEEKL